MSKHLDDLRRALTEPPGPHLDDQLLAEMAAAEAAGQDIDALYAAEVAHMERCPDCAAEYDELVALSSAAVSGMAAAAQAVTPQEVFIELLQREQGEPMASEAARRVVAALPLLFTQPPPSPAAFDKALAGQAIPAQSAQASPILQAVRRNLSALAAYLTGAANSIWGRALDAQTAVSTQGYNLHFWPAPAPAIPTLSSQAVGDEWTVLSRRVGQTPALHVEAHARRQSALTCTLTVRVDRPGLADAAGRAVTIAYGEQSVTAVTDANAIATFSDVPIVALAGLVLTIEEQTQAGSP